MPSVILGGLAAALLLAPTTPAMAAPVKPLTPAQLRAALVTPEDLGDGFVPNTKRNREVLDAKAARTKKCVKAIKALSPLLRSKAAVFIDKEGKPSGIKQFAISGAPARMASWQTVGKVMARDCVRGNASADDVGETITKLSVGKLGDWAYGIRYTNTVPEANLSPVHAADVVLIRVKNTVTLLVSDGFFSTFDPGLSKRAARVAVPKLRDAQ
ncbi:hypothetical protein [Streptosporangium roseum]|uniref:PknH-like extracellular domain-containing protein n=1 Tax=Streptosporangium roseum (strain ATCC 12428 / DSM 43021 / JCM 3005 / KCTC 9067 / NCIMB 10171 / NRRL 2505 / NI 9100) TaxID=479432 RepID=D2AUG1_STRRD|nr:hypothetical protein [Streptosporangium roseum]ACZ90616.1 hypothetical protein Sros_7961 [Streptosporangium roseum DSM 43021]